MIGPVRPSKVWSSPKSLDTLVRLRSRCWISRRTQGSVRPFYGRIRSILTAIDACFDLSPSAHSVVEWAIDLLADRYGEPGNAGHRGDVVADGESWTSGEQALPVMRITHRKGCPRLYRGHPCVGVVRTKVRVDRCGRSTVEDGP